MFSQEADHAKSEQARMAHTLDMIKVSVDQASRPGTAASSLAGSVYEDAHTRTRLGLGGFHRTPLRTGTCGLTDSRTQELVLDEIVVNMSRFCKDI